ncbi:MAG: hypothetical protein IFJ96_06330 [Acidobacteria bacterium]|nr:hypothetical protein [Candidatus Sulfomarinibacter sp. MAG AM2]
MRGIEQIPLFYDLMTAVAEAIGFGSWRQKLVRGPRGRILDVGCGTARNTEASVTAAGFEIEAEGRRSRRNVLLFVGRPEISEPWED